jgi:ankyrin repeat protein
MTDSASAANESDAALMALLLAIAARDHKAALRWLAEAPRLATQSVTAGATREAPKPYFFENIAHYAYAGDTPLHLAAAAHLRPIAEALIATGASVSAQNRRGAQPLHYAADGIPGSAVWSPDEQAATIVCLIGAGANPNADDKSGVLPLHRAVRTRCAAAVRALLEHGADARRKNKSGSTPLHLAVQNTGRGGSGSAEARQQQHAIIELLLSHGARLTDKDARGKSVRQLDLDSALETLLTRR